MRVTTKGRVTIPQEIRNRLGLLPHNWPETTRAFARPACTRVKAPGGVWFWKPSAGAPIPG
jgi:hypothetical protein